MNQKGVSLYITIALVFILMSIVLGLSTILLGQIKVIKSVEDSVIALYAAESGIEEVLISRNNPVGVSGSLGNNSSYSVTILTSASPGCSAANYCIQSVGTFKESKRAIRVSY